MALRIGLFVSRFRVSKRHQKDAGMIDSFVRERFAADLADHLGPSLSRQPAIVRIRRLKIKLAIPAANFGMDVLSRVWTMEFGRALFTALAYPGDAGPVEVYRAETLAAFIAGAIQALSDGSSDRQWQFREFEPMFRKGRAEGTLALLAEWPRQTLPVLIELERARSLERVLGGLNVLLLERLLSVLDWQTDYAPVFPSGLLAVAKLAARKPPRNAAELRSRAYAIRLFVSAAIDGRPLKSAHALFHSLATLHTLLDIDGWFESYRQLRAFAPTLPGVVADVLERIEREALSSRGPTLLGRLAETIEEIRAAVQAPPPSISAPGARWITSPWCGLFFLCSVLDRLDWPYVWRSLPEFQTGGISPLLAGVLLTLTGQFEEAPQALDPAVALLAGYEGDADLAHLRRVYVEYPEEVRAALLQAADVTGDTQTWAATFEALASALVARFGSLIRGFRQASRQAIVRGFLAQTGRIRVEKHRIAVYPDPHPFQVALHISSLDAPVESASWLGSRRVEFRLEAL